MANNNDALETKQPFSWTGSQTKRLVAILVVLLKFWHSQSDCTLYDTIISHMTITQGFNECMCTAGVTCRDVTLLVTLR